MKDYSYRTDPPTYITAMGTQRWENDQGCLGRIGAPAIIWHDGEQDWFRNGKLHRGFTPAISKKAQKVLAEKFFELKLHRMVHLQLPQLAEILADKLRGWFNYYGKFRMSEMRFIMRVLNFRLVRWVKNKYKRFRNRHWYNAYL